MTLCGCEHQGASVEMVASVDLGLCRQQGIHCGKLSGRRGQGKRRVAVLVPGFDIGACCDQSSYGIVLTAYGGVQDQRPPVLGNEPCYGGALPSRSVSRIARRLGLQTGRM